MNNNHRLRRDISARFHLEEELAAANFVAIMMVQANRPVNAFEAFRNAFAANGSVVSGTSAASKESIDAMPIISVSNHNLVKDCIICLDEIGVGGQIRFMPCTHGFHSDCIEKWLKYHRSCPVCRFVMPAVPQDRPDDHAAHDNDDGGNVTQSNSSSNSGISPDIGPSSESENPNFSSN